MKDEIIREKGFDDFGSKPFLLEIREIFVLLSMTY